MPAALLGFDKKPIYVPKSIKIQKTPKKSHTERVTEDASLSLTITNAPHSNLATTERSAVTLHITPLQKNGIPVCAPSSSHRTVNFIRKLNE
jgi:hypothetical protein